jgi:hypothetical protein
MTGVAPVDSLAEFTATAAAYRLTLARERAAMKTTVLQLFAFRGSELPAGE